MGWHIREATSADHDEVITLCTDIWEQRDGDYLPQIYPEWIHGEDRRTLVIEEAGTVQGICQSVMLTPEEAWCQGLRIAEEARGEGHASALLDQLLQWAASEGATVARCMVHSWNGAGMGIARAVGFSPVAGYRWGYIEPSPNALPLSVSHSASAAWQIWRQSDAQQKMGGLTVDHAESWAVTECRREYFHRQPSESGTLVVIDGESRGLAVRGRQYALGPEKPGKQGLEYGATAWNDHRAATAVFDAIAADAGTQGVSEVRVLIPETPQYLSEAAPLASHLSEAGQFVYQTDLLTYSRRHH